MKVIKLKGRGTYSVPNQPQFYSASHRTASSLSSVNEKLSGIRQTQEYFALENLSQNWLHPQKSSFCLVRERKKERKLIVQAPSSIANINILKAVII